MYVTPSAPQSIGGVIDDAIRLYRHTFSRCWILVFLPAVALGAYQLIIARYLPIYSMSPVAQFHQSARHPLPGVVLIYILVVSLVAAGFQGAVAARQAALARHDDSLTLGRAFATGFLRIPTFIVSLILLYIVMIGAMLIVAIAVALPVGWLMSRLHPLTRTVMSAGFALLFLAALLIVMGRLQLFMAAIFIDRQGPLASLKTSWRLTAGHWWRAMGILTTATIMLIVLFLAATLLSDLDGYLTHYGAVHRLVIGPLLMIVSYVVLYPLAAAIWVAMYHDFKLRREGGDLAARVGALNSA